MDELAHQGHLLVRHKKKGLKCEACNVYRADRHFNFWSRTLGARPCAADVISCSRNKKTQHIHASTDISVFSKTVFSTASSHVTSTSTRLDEVSGLDLVSQTVCLDVRSTDDPSQISCLPNMPRPFSQSGGSSSASELVAFSESHDVHDIAFASRLR